MEKNKKLNKKKKKKRRKKKKKRKRKRKKKKKKKKEKRRRGRSGARHGSFHQRPPTPHTAGSFRTRYLLPSLNHYVLAASPSSPPQVSS